MGPGVLGIWMGVGLDWVCGPGSESGPLHKVDSGGQMTKESCFQVFSKQEGLTWNPEKNEIFS